MMEAAVGWNETFACRKYATHVANMQIVVAGEENNC